MKTFLALFGVLVSIPALIVVGSLINGLVLSNLWGWFVVPTFGLPQLSLVPAIGVAMVVRFLTHQYIESPEKKEKKDSTERWTGLVVTLFSPFITLLFGWIVHLFM